MSHDLQVFGAEPVTDGRFTAALAALDLHTEGTPSHAAVGHTAVGRTVRGERRHAFTWEGPFPVERSDLPDEVATRLLGITAMYEVSVDGGGRTEIATATRFAREIAAQVSGGVYDRQSDRLVWPRGTRRRFKPPKAERIDTLALQWFVRREDAPPDLPALVLESLRVLLPEAMPRRFGDVEPLPHRFEESGADGFVQNWRASQELLWSTTSPCLDGAMSFLGESVVFPKGVPDPDHIVGQFSLTFDLRALDDVRWQHELTDAFCRLAETSGAFFAQAAVERSWGYGGGSLWADKSTKTIPSRVTRQRTWRTLLPHPMWLAWYGPLYRPLVEPFIGEEWTDKGAGLLRRDGEHPNDAQPVPWHAKLSVPEGLT